MPELASWIAKYLAGQNARSAAVLHAGGGRVARRLAQEGLRIRTIDALRAYHARSAALLPDGPAVIDDRHLAEWLRMRKEPESRGRFADWSHRAFTSEEAGWLGSWRANILEGDAPPRLKAMGTVVVQRVMAYWLAWNRPMEGRAAPRYRLPDVPEAQLSHKPLPPAAIFRHYAEEVNLGIGRGGIAHDVVFAPNGRFREPSDCDLLYCYVPPREGMTAMDSRLPYWERWILGDPAAPLPFEASGRLGSFFDSEEDRAAALGRLLRQMVEVPICALAYSGTGSGLLAAVREVRPVLAHLEKSVPYPGPSESAIIAEGLIVAGNAA